MFRTPIRLSVMAGLDPAIHGNSNDRGRSPWMPGSSPGMTVVLAASA
jgi:hypothetical protein